MKTTAIDLLQAFETGAMTARNHIENVLRTAQDRADLGAVVAIDAAAPRAAANQADFRRTERRARRLKVLTIGLKDNIDTVDLPTTGTRARRPTAPHSTSTARRYSAIGPPFSKPRYHLFRTGPTRGTFQYADGD